jgi:hypothetical protein
MGPRNEESINDSRKRGDERRKRKEERRVK